MTREELHLQSPLLATLARFTKRSEMVRTVPTSAGTQLDRLRRDRRDSWFGRNKPFVLEKFVLEL